jgi:hypothetical protein
MAYLSIRSLPTGPLPLQVRRLISLALSGRRERRAVEELRCERGAGIARKIGCSDEVAQAIMDLHEHWDGHGLPRGLRRDAIPLLSRIVAVCAGLDIFCSLREPAAARQVIRARGGTWYDPELTTQLLALCDGGLLDELGAPTLKEVVFSADGNQAIAFASDADIDRIASAFADIVDAKSPWTGPVATRSGSPPLAGALPVVSALPATGFVMCASVRCSMTSASSAFRTRSSTSRQRSARRSGRSSSGTRS